MVRDSERTIIFDTVSLFFFYLIKRHVIRLSTLGPSKGPTSIRSFIPDDGKR